MRLLVPIIALLVVPLLAADTPEPKSVRVLCWNIHHGVGGDGKLDLERIAAVIRKADPDLVALQEVDKQCTRSGNTDQCAELARLTRMQGVFGKAMDFQGGGYGQAILSRHPILSHTVHPLPGTGEPRIAFEASISLGGSEIRLISVHLGLEPEQRIDQANALVKLLEKSSSPGILCGDFNAGPGSPPLELVSRHWQAVPKEGPRFTCPAGEPTMEIDHFFVRGFMTSKVQVIEEPVASDHRPLFSVFTLE